MNNLETVNDLQGELLDLRGDVMTALIKVVGNVGIIDSAGIMCMVQKVDSLVEEVIYQDVEMTVEEMAQIAFDHGKR